MSGLELMRGLADGSLPPASITVTMPMYEYAVEPGRVRFKARADDRHLNPLGMVHGGFACTVLDSATGIAVHSLLEAGGWLATIDLNVKFFRPVPKDEDVLVEGWITNTSQALMYSEAKIVNGTGKMLAPGSAYSRSDARIVHRSSANIARIAPVRDAGGAMHTRSRVWRLEQFLPDGIT